MIERINYKKKFQTGILLFATFWLSGIALGYGQDVTIQGNVTDDQNEPLPGASILVKGTTNGTQTDFDGNYTISTSSDATLIVSYLGFTAQEISINGRSTVDVTMAVDANQLEEVVVIGYGTQKKSDLTGAVGQVKGDDIGKFVSSSNPTQSLQGKVAGVQVDTDGGSPGAGAFVTIRGSGTLSDAQPLYVVDGLFARGIENLNPADIESVSVLKDASAAAIYGQRAANGVIIVTTKKGKSGKVQIDLDVSRGFDEVVNQIEFANARQYADIRNAANDNDGQPRALANDTQFNPNIDTDIQDASLRSGQVFNANLRVSGGNENATYSVSANRLTREGIVKQSGFERSGLRINTTFDRGRFRLEQNLNLTQSKRQDNPYFNQERDHLPTIPIWTGNTDIFEGGFAGSAAPDGTLGFHGVQDVINSLGIATLEERLVTENAVQGNIIASYELFDGLTYKLNAGIDYFARNNFKYTPTYLFARSNNGQNPTNTLDERNTNFLSTLVENTLNYNKDFGKHTIGVLAGFTEQRTTVRSLGIIAQNFPSNEIRIASAAENLQAAPSEESLSALQSWIGRLNYSYDSRYSFTGTIRRDGSSLFASELRYGTFISAAGAWNIINESFMENQNTFDNLKLRVSYGELGSSNINAYSIAPILNTSSSFIDGSGGRASGFAQTAGVNPDLQWETTTTTNIGLDAAFLDNKLQITADYFTKESADILALLPPSNFLGFGNNVPANAATIENKGFEFLAGYNTNIGELALNLSTNFTILKNEVTSLGEGVLPIQGGDFTSNGDRRITRTEPGHSVAELWGFKVLGIYQTDQEAIDDGRVDAVAGDLRFQDTDGDGQLTEDDRVFLGKSIPDFTYGFNVGATYKNWDLSLFFNGVTGNKIANASIWRFTFDNTGNYLPEVTNAWTSANNNTTVPRATVLETGFNGRPSDYFIEDGSYFRLRNLQLGYSLPEKWISAIGISRARLYMSAVNLFTITDYTGYYPESGRSNRGNNTQLFNQGVDDGAYPIPRTYQWGAQISF